MSNEPYFVGRWLGRHWKVVAGIGAAIVAYLWYQSFQVTQIEQARLIASSTMGKPLQQPSQADTCRYRRAALVSEHHQLRQAGKHWPAANVLRGCAQATQDAELLELVRLAESEDRWLTVKDKKASASDRLQALNALAQIDPERAANTAKLRSELETAERRADADRKKRGGVHVGMSKADVHASAWGKPDHINQTVTQLGTREQWVYGIGNYLYFEGDRLTAIQTAR